MAAKNEALNLWMTVPENTRRMLLSNVWCGKCQRAVTMIDYHAQLREVVILRGVCGTCGHEVARVVEDLGPVPKKKAKATKLDLYIFNVWLYGDERSTETKKIIRKIQIPGAMSLHRFAEVILSAFDFELDHCFGFYDNLRDRRHCRKAFELFVDLGEEGIAPHAKGVKKTKISQAFDCESEKLIMLFDYGDGWQFHVDLKEIRKDVSGTTKPQVLERIGQAPLQYPPCDEEDSEA